MKTYKLISYFLVSCLAISACKPKIAKDQVLPAPSPARFVVAQYYDPKFPDDKNTYIFKNTTDGGFVSSWDFGGLETSSKPVDTVFFAYKGKYMVKLISASKGGSSTTFNEIDIAETSPYASNFDFVKVDEYHYNLAVTTPAAFVDSLVWTFSDGVKTSKRDTSAYFPWKGKQTVSLKVYTAKGSSTLTKEVVIGSDDPNNPALNDNLFKILTGGVNDVDGRTWVVSPAGKIQGVGPYMPNAIALDYYAYPDGLQGDPAWAEGALKNEWTFVMRDYKYIPKNKRTTVNYLWIREEFEQPLRTKYSDGAFDSPKQVPAPFILKNTGIGITGYTLQFGNGSFLAYYDNRYIYEIAKISQDSLWIRHSYNDEDTDPNHNNPKFDGNQRVILFVAKK